MTKKLQELLAVNAAAMAAAMAAARDSRDFYVAIRNDESIKFEKRVAARQKSLDDRDTAIAAAYDYIKNCPKEAAHKAEFNAIKAELAEAEKKKSAPPNQPNTQGEDNEIQK